MTTRAGIPSFSIVTPCYNQVDFVAATLQSVAQQNYPSLEYIVVDDGSTDGTSAVLRENEQSISRLITHPNQGFGQTLHDALNLCTGEVMAWINSDDCYLPGAFAAVAKAFTDCPEVDWLVGASLITYRDGSPVAINAPAGFAKSLFFSGRYLGGHPGWSGAWIPQESVFWRRSLWEKAGARFLLERKQYGDFELWSRFWRHSELNLLPIPLAAYRHHADTYTTLKGNTSTEPCTEIIEASGLGKYRPWEMQWRSRLCRTSASLARRLGEPARVLRFDQSENKWKQTTVYVM
jgi:glycosyltransferase involved in cell wall biosynthesis